MKNPFIWRSVNDRVTVEVNLNSFFMIWAFGTCGGLGIVVVFSCVFTFSCLEFLPTFSYLGAFNLYDKALVFIAAAQTIPLILFFTATFVGFKKFMNWVDSYTLLAIGLAFSVMLPSIFILDEVNSSYYFPFDRLHLILLCCLLLILTIWLLFSLEWLYKMFQQDPRKELKIIAVYIIFVFISLWYSCQLWKSSEGPEDYQKLALSEYLCIVLLSFLPRVYLFAFPETRLSIGQQKLIKIDE